MICVLGLVDEAERGGIKMIPLLPAMLHHPQRLRMKPANAGAASTKIILPRITTFHFERRYFCRWEISGRIELIGSGSVLKGGGR